MSEKKFSPEDVVKILRACAGHGISSQAGCRICPANNAGCYTFRNEVVAADTIEELLERRQMDADLMQEQKERIVELENQLQWISVGEKLPAVHEECVQLDEAELTKYWGSEPGLACVEFGTLSVLRYEDDGDGATYWFAEDGAEYTVTHWRPLPEVPGEEGE